MLSRSHNRAYQDFLTLLTNFQNFLLDLANSEDVALIKSEFGQLEMWFQQNIANLDTSELEAEIIPRWQSIQTEIRREFKLLTTDILFLVSARQNTTKMQRIEAIQQRLSKLSSYCRVMNA